MGMPQMCVFTYLMRLRAFSSTAAGTSGGGVIEPDLERPLDRLRFFGDSCCLLLLGLTASMISRSESSSSSSESSADNKLERRVSQRLDVIQKHKGRTEWLPGFAI